MVKMKMIIGLLGPIDASCKFDVEDSYFEFDVKDLYFVFDVDGFLLQYCTSKAFLRCQT